jgi:adenine C2-methylase RlmN of 23S rRNA A2503 and tRNA A37
MSDQINVPISPGELVDKITILEIKKEFIKENNKLKNINLEYDLLMKIYDDKVSNTEGVLELKNKLKKINLKLWKIEDDIRDCERDKSFSDVFINLARSVYFTNDDRSKIKLEINLLLNSNLVEEKSYKEYS